MKTKLLLSIFLIASFSGCVDYTKTNTIEKNTTTSTIKFERPDIASCKGYKYEIVERQTQKILKCADVLILPARLEGCKQKLISPAQCGVLYGKDTAEYLVSEDY